MNTKIAESQHALVRWALRIREFQDRARQVSQGGAELQLWIVRPVKEVVVLAVLVVVTFLAGALRPKLLYAANGIGSIEHAKRPVFLNYRSFVLSVLALFQLFANQSIVGKLKEDQSELQLLPELALEGLFLLMLFLIVALGALSVWVGARCSKARLSMSQSMKVSGYGLGTVQLGLLIILPIVLVITSVTSEFFRSAPTVVWVIPVIFLTVLIYIGSLYVSFVGPVSAYHPGVARVRLWYGWFVGQLLILGAMLMIVLLVGIVVLGVGAALSRSS